MFEHIIQQNKNTGYKRQLTSQGNSTSKQSRADKENSPIHTHNPSDATQLTTPTPPPSHTIPPPTLPSPTKYSDTNPPPPASQTSAMQTDIQIFESIIREEANQPDTGNIISSLGNMDIQSFTKIVTNKISQYLSVNESHPMIRQNKIFIIKSIEELTPENLPLLMKLQIAISCRMMIGIKLNKIDVLRDKIDS